MTRTVHFFTKGHRSVPSSRYRAFDMADQLNNGAGPFSARCHTALSGSDVVAFKSASGLATELRELAHIRDQAQSLTDGDIIYCQRTVYKRLRALYLLMKATSWPMVFDFDDSIFLHKPHIIRWFLGRADVVVITVSSRNLLNTTLILSIGFRLPFLLAPTLTLSTEPNSRMSSS